MTIGAVPDPASGVLIPQPKVPQGRVGIGLPRAKGYGYITYRCHTCGELIPRTWEVFFVDDTPGGEWASYVVPPKMTTRTTTHHDIHMSSLTA